MDLLADLDARGLIHDSTDRAALAARLAERADHRSTTAATRRPTASTTAT